MFCNRKFYKPFSQQTVIAGKAQGELLTTMTAKPHLGVSVTHAIKPTRTIPEPWNFKSETLKTIKNKTAVVGQKKL